MPTVRKLSSDEVRTIENRGKGLRKLIEEEYDTFLSEYSIGDYGEAELGSDEKRLTVRNRLKAAARRRNLSIDFKRTQGSILRFRISAADSNGGSSETEGKAKGRSRKKS
jgi:hypothetical protein